MCKRRSLSSMVTGIFTMENHETLFIFVESAVKHRFEVNKATWKGKMRRFSGCEENKKVLPDYEKFDTEREMCVCTARRWADFQWRITLSMFGSYPAEGYSNLQASVFAIIDATTQEIVNEIKTFAFMLLFYNCARFRDRKISNLFKFFPPSSIVIDVNES